MPKLTRENVAAILDRDKSPTKAYRVALVIQLAYGLAADEPLDITVRHPGARGANGVAGRCGALLKDRHVVASKDVFQNIGKNTTNLARGNFPDFDAVLAWASKPARTKDQLTALLEFACSAIAATARPVLKLPEIDQSKLTFAAIMTLFDEMFRTPSAGAHEQFIVAALLQARLEQEGRSQYVDTKNLNASDQSSRSAADVQIKSGTRVDEAYEVSANDWATKLADAVPTMKAHDLARLHILARVDDPASMLKALSGLAEDISAIDLRAFVSVHTDELRKQFRAAALVRLYELLDRYQPNVELVNAYVTRLGKQGLAVH